eukprot:CAMPEP_0115340298 /NCGR_PEP_ID=MMETSP0270-20121206/91073_1 /TAXON_ID=71861 /ORGANISM="Scrippsiella trochoidea, Strain CCMP3099" /LENGTH=37 /DNA_ID= /DNA_START= /DNA_END= /DNA_ORIENTATION=
MTGSDGGDRGPLLSNHCAPLFAVHHSNFKPKSEAAAL